MDNIDRGSKDMRTCEIYVIKREVAECFYGREDKIFRLFQQYEQCSSTLKAIIEKQIEYITEPVPVMKIQHAVKKHLMVQTGYKEGYFKYFIELPKSKGKLVISLKKLVIISEGTLDAEMTFFEAIRKIQLPFIAIDLKNERYGWLHPLKDLNFAESPFY